MPGIAAVLLPLIPGLVKYIMDVISAARADPLNAEESKAKLDSISADLKMIVADVQAVELPNKQ